MSAVREIPLNGGVVALIDEEDWPLVAEYRWRHQRTPHGSGYVVAHTKRVGGKRQTVAMHRVILRPGPGQWVDHANHDGLDNRRCNIRLCTPSQNAQNRRRIRGSIPLRGVSKRPDGKFQAAIRANGDGYFLGSFDTAVAAALAYDAAARILHGEFGHLNFPHRQSTLPERIDFIGLGEPHPALATICRDVALARQERIEAARAEWEREKRALEEEAARRRAANDAVFGQLPVRVADIARAYFENPNGSEVGAQFGISRERVRQILARAEGAGFQRPPTARPASSRYDEAFCRRVAELAAAEGDSPVARTFGIAETNVRAWRAAFADHTPRAPGRPTLADAAERDRRLAEAAAALAAATPRQSSSEAA